MSKASTSPLPLDTKAWLTNMELRLCRPEDRGVLIDLMCIAHNGVPYGYVTTPAGGRPMTDAMLATYLHMTIDEFSACKARLLAAHRIAIAEQIGAIFIPRMVRDGAQRLASSEGGRKGGGNPALLPGLNVEHDEQPAKPKPVTLATYIARLPEHLKCDAVKDALREWLEYRQRSKFITTSEAVTRQVNILAPLTPEQAVEWITCAIDRQWRGFYPPPTNVYRAGRSAKPKPKEYEETPYVRHIARP